MYLTLGPPGSIRPGYENANANRKGRSESQGPRTYSLRLRIPGPSIRRPGGPWGLPAERVPVRGGNAQLAGPQHDGRSARVHGQLAERLVHFIRNVLGRASRLGNFVRAAHP